MRKTILAAQCAVALGAISVGHVNAFEIKPQGKLHLDHAIHKEDVRDITDRGVVRRAELGVEGKFAKDFSFEFDYDFTDDGEVKDAYVEYGGWNIGDIRGGQFKVPYGFEEQTSSNDTMFIERSLPNGVFGHSRRTGVSFERKEDRYTFAVMGFGSAIDGDKGNGAAARMTFAPINTVDNVVHLGIAATTENPDEDVINLRSFPESRPTDFRFIRTGQRIDAVDRINRVGLEFAWKGGPFAAQAEWMGADVNRGAGNPDEKFDGWYVSGSWILTGESREYKDGRFRGIKPSRNTGAWELATRYSTVDLDNTGILGGRQENVTLGLNWYAKDYVRISANYIKVNSDRRGISDDPEIFLVRGQLAF